MRQDLGDEGAEQAARQYARQDVAEQREIVAQDVRDTIDAVAPPHQGRADRDQHGDHDHRPADRFADVSGTRLAVRDVVGGRRIFQRKF